MEGVVRCLLQIRATEPYSKSLVFSTVCACVLVSFLFRAGTSQLADYKGQIIKGGLDIRV